MRLFVVADFLRYCSNERAALRAGRAALPVPAHRGLRTLSSNIRRNHTEAGAAIVSPFPLVCPSTRDKVPVSTPTSLRYTNDIRSNILLELPCARKDRSTSAAAIAVDPAFSQRYAIVVQAIGSLAQQPVRSIFPRRLLFWHSRHPVARSRVAVRRIAALF